MRSARRWACCKAGRRAYNSLGAAIDSHRYAIEMLYLLHRCLPGEAVRFTEFEQMPQQWAGRRGSAYGEPGDRVSSRLSVIPT
ncbi:MAG: hypothetical protein WDN28_33405 [Chthoniobacter sp.]